MAWCFEDEATAYTDAILASLGEPHAIVVPPLWHYEVVNVVLQAVRRNRISAAKAREFVDSLAGFTIQVEEGSSRVFESVYELAVQYRLTSYDAAYLELALRRNLPLATLDEDLKLAAIAAGVALLDG